MVSRLAGQKGFDILCESLAGFFKMGAVLVILGTGEEAFQNALSAARKKHPASLGLKIAYDDALSHKIYAGSDMFLIPSRYEPCGLTQMYSLRYGTVPVVRATGGLDYTIQEYDPISGTGNGFKFQDYTSTALLSSVQKAIAAYQRKERWRQLVQKAMAYDFSWEVSAREYVRLYQRLSTF
jgi:starch synthase